MWRSRTCLLALGWLLIWPAAADWDAVRERGFLRVAVYRDYLPFSFNDQGVTRGVDVELGKALAQRLGVDAAIMVFTADETVEDDLRNMVWKGHYLGTGVADVMMHVPADPILEDDKVQILAPYFRAEVMVLYDPEQLSGADRLEVFDDHKVGVETDTLADHYLSSYYGGRYRANVVHFMTVQEAARALQNREIAAYMGPLTHIQGALGDKAQRYRIARPPLRGLASSAWNVGVAIKSEQPQLAEKIGAAMRSLLQDGTVERLFASYWLRYQTPQ